MCKLNFRFSVSWVNLFWSLSNHQPTYSRNVDQVCKPEVSNRCCLPMRCMNLVKPRVKIDWGLLSADSWSIQLSGSDIRLLHWERRGRPRILTRIRGRDSPMRTCVLGKLYLRSARSRSSSSAFIRALISDSNASSLPPSWSRSWDIRCLGSGNSWPGWRWEMLLMLFSQISVTTH